MLRIRTAVEGAFLRISRVACAPSRPGIDMSITTTRGRKLLDHLDGVDTGARLADHLDLRTVLEDSAEAFANELVVVDQEDGDLLHTVVTWASGTSRVTRVPPSVGRTNSSLPCKMSARSRIAINPNPPDAPSATPTP